MGGTGWTVTKELQALEVEEGEHRTWLVRGSDPKAAAVTQTSVPPHCHAEGGAQVLLCQREADNQQLSMSSRENGERQQKPGSGMGVTERPVVAVFQPRTVVIHCVP